MDAYQKHMISTEGVYIKPLWQIEHEQRMAEIKATLEYNIDPDNIPTWASPELGFELFKAKQKKK